MQAIEYRKLYIEPVRSRDGDLEGEEMVTYPSSPVCSLRRTRGALGNVISAWKLLESSSSLTVYLRSREFATAHISIAADSRSFPFVVEYA